MSRIVFFARCFACSLSNSLASMAWISFSPPKKQHFPNNADLFISNYHDYPYQPLIKGFDELELHNWANIDNHNQLKISKV